MITCGREGKLVSKSKRKKKPMHNHGMAWHVGLSLIDFYYSRITLTRVHTVFSTTSYGLHIPKQFAPSSMLTMSQCVGQSSSSFHYKCVTPTLISSLVFYNVLRFIGCKTIFSFVVAWHGMVCGAIFEWLPLQTHSADFHASLRLSNEHVFTQTARQMAPSLLLSMH